MQTPVYTHALCAATKKEKWVKESQGQLIITAGQIVWTHECEKALADADSARKAVKALKKKWIRCVCVCVCVCVCGGGGGGVGRGLKSRH